MPFPIPFVAGAVVGAVSTYVYKDESAKKWLDDTSSKLKKSTQALFKKKPENTEPDAKKGDVIEGAAEEVIENDARASDTTPTDTKQKSKNKE